MSKQEVEQAAKQIEQALRQGQVLARKMAGNTPRELGELLAPAVDWRQALRDFVTERAKGGDYATYAKPNRRYVGHGMYMPSTYTETVKSILFACDTSGSIGAEDLREVLSEVRGCLEIVKPETVDVIYWDTAVARHERYVGADVETVISSTKPAGGGGTAPSCVVPFCHERGIKPTVAIWLSDGYVGGDWAEELGVPSFWVISSGGQCPSHLPHVQLPARG
jgi:predicted metal-dependent peptidase